MLPAGTGTGSRDARELARGTPLSQHGRSEGPQGKHTSRSRLASLPGRPALQNLTHTIRTAIGARRILRNRRRPHTIRIGEEESTQCAATHCQHSPASFGRRGTYHG
jgi:hypothetical protein